jgi:glucoamylase
MSKVLWGLATIVLFLSNVSSSVSYALTTEQQEVVSIQKVLESISRPDTQPGFVIASPSKQNPNYYFHWTRDAALVMSTLVTLLENTTWTTQDSAFKELKNYVNFSRRNQQTQTLSPGFGEPKFNTDGSGYTGSWGRPQNDGPALRALTLIRFANLLKTTSGFQKYVSTELYDGKLPTNSVIKADLEFTAHNWRAANFDLWEEVKGDHFYTRLAQLAAMLEGSQFAKSMNDPGAAAFYSEQASAIEKTLTPFWNSKSNFIRVTLNRVDGVDYKFSDIDIAVILGVLHTQQTQSVYKPESDKVMLTAMAIEEAFKNLYSINNKGAGVSIGRYPEDRYDGVKTGSVGNPWFLTTFAMSEYYSSLAKNWRAQGKIAINSTNRKFFMNLVPGLLNSNTTGTIAAGEYRFERFVKVAQEKAADFLTRGLLHSNKSNGSMSEQFSRNNGFMQGAQDLTWSYASYLTAYWAMKN